MPCATFPAIADSMLPSELELAMAGLTLRGTSLFARATAFIVPELSVALDCGRMTPALAQQPVVLLSHAHLDHLAGILAYLNVRARFFAREPTVVWCESGVARRLHAALEVMPGMESVRKRLRLAEVIRGVEPGMTVPLPGGEARAFAADHNVVTLGWTLRRRGERRPALVYAADGTTDPFRASPGLLDADVAVVECSFLERNRRIAARLGKHAHVLDWTELAPQLTCDTLVLGHLPPLPARELRELAAPLARALHGQLVLWTSAEGAGGDGLGDAEEP